MDASDCCIVIQLCALKSRCYISNGGVFNCVSFYYKNDLSHTKTAVGEWEQRSVLNRDMQKIVESLLIWLTLVTQKKSEVGPL